MKHYAICGEDKCYSEVYTKEEVDSLTRLSTQTFSSTLPLPASQSMGTLIEVKRDGYVPLGIVGIDTNGNCIISSFALHTTQTGMPCANIGITSNASIDLNLTVKVTVLYRKASA